MATGDVSLNPNVRSADTVEFQNALRAKIVGQDDGVQALVELFQVFTAGLNSPGRPVGNLLFLGPTGFRQDAHRRSRRGNTFWQSARRHQN